MKRFIFVITMALGWTGLSFSNPVLTQKTIPPIQSLATETVTGKKVTGFCSPKVTAETFLFTNAGIALGGLIFATAVGVIHIDDFWPPFLALGGVASLLNHAVQLALSSTYFSKCRDYIAIQ